MKKKSNIMSSVDYYDNYLSTQKSVSYNNENNEKVLKMGKKITFSLFYLNCISKKNWREIL